MTRTGTATKFTVLLAIGLAFAALAAPVPAADDPLPSWNDGATKTSIMEFVRVVTTEGYAAYVPPGERIATLDNDGTLWSEKPTYFQLIFAMDRIKSLAGQHPAWKTEQPFQAVLENDMAALHKDGTAGLMQLIKASHAGMTNDQFEDIVSGWLSTALHPKFKRPYTDLVYQPMLELIAFLQANDFDVYICSGGGISFMRVWVPGVYGIARNKVVGSSIKTTFKMQDGVPTIVRLPEIEYITDGATKPVGINRVIGIRPIFAFGNSDGDLAMLQWTTGGEGERFAGIVHHTDAAREWAYGKDSDVGHLDKALTAANKNGWTVVDMKNDWKVIYPFEMNGK